MRLRARDVDRPILIGFERWLATSAANRLAYACVAALHETIRRATLGRSTGSNQKARGGPKHTVSDK
jgi:ferric-dicitrate binding protein FerR (iron transport regulator)